MTSRTKRSTTFFHSFRFCLGLLGTAWLSTAIATEVQELSSEPSLVVVADPQIHNIAGGSVKQTWRISDWGTRVAQRYPELNLLAGYVFEDLVRRADRVKLGTDSGLVLLLGDGTNAACTGEYDRFDRSLQALREQGKLVLWAHGNHDSYLMGTSNSYMPRDEDRAALQEMASSTRPIDRSWWKPLEKPLDRRSAWNSLCVDGRGGVPMNKGQWIARYLKSFGESLAQTSTPDGDSFVIEAHGVAGSQLESLNFQVLGRWFPPKLSLDQRDYLRQPYSSYLVQAIDVGRDHRLVLIDTSVCSFTGYYLSFAWENAGSRGCLSEDELKDIARLASSPGRRLIFAGHFPLRGLGKELRGELLKIFNAGNQPWSYLSGHTHEQRSWRVADDGGSYSGDDGSPRYDLNIGSTTDWPMEAYRVKLDNSEQGMGIVPAGYVDAPRLVYPEPLKYDGWEICRHLKVAQALADVPVGKPFRGPWKRTVTSYDYRACRNSYRDAVIALEKALSTIDINMADDDYRDAMLRISVSASQAESEQEWLGKHIIIP